MKKSTFITFILFPLFFISCGNKINGSIIGSWKSEHDDEAVKFAGVDIHMSSTIVLIINNDGTFEKKVDSWIGDSNIPHVQKGTWTQDNNDVTFTQLNTDSGTPFVMTQKITKLTNDKLVFEDKFKYYRIR